MWRQPLMPNGKNVVARPHNSTTPNIVSKVAYDLESCKAITILFSFANKDQLIV